MTLYVVDKGFKFGDSLTNGTSVPTNPRIINDVATSTTSVVCYEIRNNNSNPPSSATQTYSSDTAYGVSYSNSSLDVLNRVYPDNSTNGSGGATTIDSYLENLENTKGNRIKCARFSNIGTTILEGQPLVNTTDFPASAIPIDSNNEPSTNDYFVILFPDNKLKHHMAKITKITSDDYLGDSFEFSPKYSGEIPKGTKFAIYKGPLITDTEVIAVGYGLYGSHMTYEKDYTIKRT